VFVKTCILTNDIRVICHICVWQLHCRLIVQLSLGTH